MTSPLELDALVFDAYGTLLDPHAVASACEDAAPGQGHALSEAWRVRQLRSTWLRALMGRYRDFWFVTGEALDGALAELGLELEPAVREDLLHAYLGLDPYPEVRGALAAMEGVRLAVLSNGAPGMLHAALRAAELEERFEAVLSADAVRGYKPDGRVYALALDALHLPRERIGFVSANAWDAAGAKAFGFRSVWLNRSGGAYDGLFRPDLVVDDLEDFAERVA